MGPVLLMGNGSRRRPTNTTSRKYQTSPPMQYGQTRGNWGRMPLFDVAAGGAAMQDFSQPYMTAAPRGPADPDCAPPGRVARAARPNTQCARKDRAPVGHQVPVPVGTVSALPGLPARGAPAPSRTGWCYTRACREIWEVRSEVAALYYSAFLLQEAADSAEYEHKRPTRTGMGTCDPYSLVNDSLISRTHCICLAGNSDNRRVIVAIRKSTILTPFTCEMTP